jgi:AcrR family transcriptional regulator
MKAGARPRRGAPAKGEVSARERILATASELFYREGIRAIGVDTVVERSGVSKTSLYRLFDSKDALITAFAAEKDRLFWAWWDRLEEQHATDPRALLEALLSGIGQRIGHSTYRGCPFLNLATEFPDDNHPGRAVAQGNKEGMRARLATIVAKLGVSDPDRTASQIALIINGAYVTGLIVEPTDLVADLVDAAMKLLAGNGRTQGAQAKPFSKKPTIKGSKKIMRSV